MPLARLKLKTRADGVASRIAPRPLNRAILHTQYERELKDRTLAKSDYNDFDKRPKYYVQRCD